jgi:(p)ppGpp synthase/HD superfamily hydrolase
MNHPTLQQTLFTMMALHDGQMDKSGVPYFYHPIRVMVRLGPDAQDSERHAALLHDVIEDTPITLDILRDMGYSEEVLKMVSLLTRQKTETHRSYIFQLIGSGNVGAMRAKLADLYDNANVERAMRCEDEVVRKGILDMIESRYKPAIRMMKEVLGKESYGIIEEDLDVELKEAIHG